VLDVVPLAGAGREVTHRNGQTGASGELLQFPLPEPQARAVAPTRISGNQERLRLAIGGSPHLLPPPANRLHGEGRGVVIDPHTHPAVIMGRIVHAIRTNLFRRGVCDRHPKPRQCFSCSYTALPATAHIGQRYFH